MNREATLITGVGLACAALIVTVAIVSTRRQETTAAPMQSVAGAHATELIGTSSYVKGPENASVEVVEFADFQCPACAAAYPQVEQLFEQYQDKGVSLRFRNFPLPQHAYAKLAANAVEAAGQQGKYWQMVDLVYRGQADWAPETSPQHTEAFATAQFEHYATLLQLNLDQYKAAVAAKAFQSKIDQDVTNGTSLGVHGTPTFYVNGVEVHGVAQLEQTIKTDLKI